MSISPFFLFHLQPKYQISKYPYLQHSMCLRNMGYGPQHGTQKNVEQR